jgi:hypothetical protein
MRGWFMQQGSHSVEAMKKSMGAMYGMIQQQAALLSFVEAFWIMGVILLCMLPLLSFLRDARDLHKHDQKPGVSEDHKQPVPASAEPELAGAFH